ncbi:MAG: hypothetical protein ACJ79R_02995 [Anaeromyxobacteraceae bacterium]
MPMLRKRLGEAEVAGRKRAPAGRGTAGRPRRRPPRVEMTRWVADRNARRVPTFVIEATGLDTKKKIVARFGENAAFEAGKPLPPARSADGTAGAGAERGARAKAPAVRKAAKAQG